MLVEVHGSVQTLLQLERVAFGHLAFAVLHLAEDLHLVVGDGAGIGEDEQGAAHYAGKLHVGRLVSAVVHK